MNIYYESSENPFLFKLNIFVKFSNNASLLVGHPSTSCNCGFQSGPSLRMREAVAITTLHYAAAHERLFSDLKKKEKKKKDRKEKNREKDRNKLFAFLFHY